MPEPWYKVCTLRKEVREGRSFNPDEFAIALEQVVAGTAPEDCREPAQFFARTSFTRALREHCGMVLRRLAGRTDRTAPVLTLITQFGGGKTHTLTTLYHLARLGEAAAEMPGVAGLMREAGLASLPRARVAVFVGNAWDPQEGRETPWIDIARQLAGDAGVAALGPAARTAPPGTETLGRLFRAAGAPVLVLFDEVLNYLNRHRGGAEPFHAFIQNLTVAMTGTANGSCVISLPRSQVEMTSWDQDWQDRISKVVRRVSKDLIVNDEAEIGEVVRRRLFEDLGREQARRAVARAYARWCFERRAQLPPQWTAVDSTATEEKARELLQRRFEACYPFHPATLSVFQRKWQSLPQYQQTRGTLAMLAQWLSLAARDGFRATRREPLVTLSSAPLGEPGFRSVVLGQLGEQRLMAAIDADIAGEHSHARALDADSRGQLRDIHRRVATAILFESSGGQTDKLAHLPELRFALGEPGLETTSIDSAALALEGRAYYLRRVGSDGFRIGCQPTLRKVVSDRKASLDEDAEVKPALREVVEKEFRRSASIAVVAFPEDSADIEDSPRLTLVVVDPDAEWSENGDLRGRIAEWTRSRGKSARLHPAALVWCVRRPGRELREKVALALAWQRVAAEVEQGILGADLSPRDREELKAGVGQAREAAREEVWASYRRVLVWDSGQPDGLREIDLGAVPPVGHATLSGRVLAALKSEALLNDSVGAGYLERNWPPAFREDGAWPLRGLRQSFLDGSLTRLLDPEKVLRAKIVEFVRRGDFGLATGRLPGGGFRRVWFAEEVPEDEVLFDEEVFLLRQLSARALKAPASSGVSGGEGPVIPVDQPSASGAASPGPASGLDAAPPAEFGEQRTIRVQGSIPSEVWNRFGTKLLPKLRATASSLVLRIDLEARVSAETAGRLAGELRELVAELGFECQVNLH